MENIFNTKVYYSDTDAYSVVWHGAYLRWLEKGRVDICDQYGFDLTELKKEDIVLPVAYLDIKYKSPAKLNDEITIKTRISKITPLYIIFFQEICSKDLKITYVQANVKVVAVNNEGKLYKKMPQKLYEAFKNEIK